MPARPGGTGYREGVIVVVGVVGYSEVSRGSPVPGSAVPGPGSTLGRVLGLLGSRTARRGGCSREVVGTGRNNDGAALCPVFFSGSSLCVCRVGGWDGRSYVERGGGGEAEVGVGLLWAARIRRSPSKVYR